MISISKYCLLFIVLSLSGASLAENSKDELKQEEKLKTIELKISDTAKEVFFVKQKISFYQKKLHAAEQEYIKLQQSHQNLEINLSTYIKQLYLINNTNVAKKLFSTNDPNKFSKTMAFYKYLSIYSNEKLLENKNYLQQNLELKQSIQENLATLNIQKTTKTQELKKLRLMYKERAAIMARLTQQIHNTGLLTKSSSRLAGLIHRYHKLNLQNAISPLDPELKLKPSDTTLLPAKQGDKVFSIYPGKIVFANWLKGFGLIIIIDHGHNIMSLYGHNQTLFKTAGDWVNKGDIISLVGKSGGYQKAGLYFEIRENGQPLANTDLNL
jgi:murein hydrolase activator